MVWDQIENIITLYDIGVSKVGIYTVRIKIENPDGKSNEADFKFEIENEIQNE